MLLKANGLSCVDHLISSFYPNYFLYKFSIVIFFLGREREREMYRAKNPWFLLRRMRLGWKVLLGNKIIGSFEEESSPVE